MHRPQAGRRVRQARDPRVLPQHDLLRPGRVRHRGGGAGVLRQVGRPPARRVGRGGGARRGDQAAGAVARPTRATTRDQPGRRQGPLELRAQQHGREGLAAAGHRPGDHRSTRPGAASGTRRSSAAWRPASTSRPATSINYVTQELAAMGDSTTGRKICEPGACLRPCVPRVCGSPPRSTRRCRRRPRTRSGAQAKAPSWTKQRKNHHGRAGRGRARDRPGARLLRRRQRHRHGLRRAQLRQTACVSGGHPPGSSFKIYTLAAALENNISLKSRWDGRGSRPTTRTATARCRTPAARPTVAATARWSTSTVKSYNVPFFYVTEGDRRRRGARDRQGRRRHDDVGQRRQGEATICSPRRARIWTARSSTTRSASASTRSPCWTTRTASPPWPTAASTTRPTSS